jgi:hypothetical protein
MIHDGIILGSARHQLEFSVNKARYDLRSKGMSRRGLRRKQDSHIPRSLRVVLTVAEQDLLLRIVEVRLEMAGLGIRLDTRRPHAAQVQAVVLRARL